MKRIILVMLALLLALSMFACKNNEQQPAAQETEQPAAQETEQPAAQETEQPVQQEPVKVAALAGPTGMGLAYMMQDMQDRYRVEIFTAPDQVTAKIINGEVDIAAVPINLASVLNNKTNGKVNVIAINTLGVLYILENGTEIGSISDLAGKTIYATGQGSTPEYVLNYLLAANGLTDSVMVEYGTDRKARGRNDQGSDASGAARLGRDGAERKRARSAEGERSLERKERHAARSGRLHRTYGLSGRAQGSGRRVSEGCEGIRR